MFEKVGICEAKKLPIYKTEVFLNNEKIMNSRLYRTKRVELIRSEGIRTDVTGAIYSENGGVFGFNAMPTVKYDEYKYVVKKELEKAWQYFMDLGYRMKGFLCGGVCSEGDERYSPFSYNLYSNIAEFFDEKQIPFSMICGKKETNAADNVSFHKDKIFMWGDYIRNCFNQNGKYETNYEIINKIPNLYSDVIMNKDTEFVAMRDLNK